METTNLFIAERIIVCGPGITPIANLRSDYLQFCHFCNLIPDGWTTVSKGLKANKFKIGQRMYAGKSTRCWLGFELSRWLSTEENRLYEALLEARAKRLGYTSDEGGMTRARKGVPNEVWDFALHYATEFLKVTPPSSVFTIDDIRDALCIAAPNCLNNTLYFSYDSFAKTYEFKIRTDWFGGLQLELEARRYMHQKDQDGDPNTVDALRSKRPPSHGGNNRSWISDIFGGVIKPTATLDIFEEE